MKKLLAIIFSVIATGLYAQKNELNTFNSESYPIENANFSEPKGIVFNEQEAKDYLNELIQIEGDYNLSLLSFVESNYAKHYTFIETFQNVEVYQALVKLNTDKKGNILSVFNSFQEINSVVESEWLPKNSLPSEISRESKINLQEYKWVKKDGQYHRSLLINYTDPIGYNYDYLINSQSQPLYVFERTSHFSPVDTIAKGYIFQPDPLTTANTNYGGSYIDNQDNTNPQLDAERVEVDIIVEYNSNTQTFLMENEFVKLANLSPPNVAPATSSTSEFYFDRSESGFENVNVIYHMTKQQNYLQSLGFTDLVNYQIEVDCHGLSGADNSVFNPTSNPPNIQFGEGGVDDAEDADVIIHEYSHAISHSAAPNTNIGSQRRALDEALGDYMAASYSRLYEYWGDCCVYNWDGHNEYWDGRLVTSSAMYPNDLQANLYLDAPIWSSALLRIERNIGRDSTNVVLLNSLYHYSSNMTMAQAAQLVLQQDSLIFNEKYYGPICYTFLDKGLVSSCKVSRPAGMVGIEDLNPKNIKILNSENFSNGTGNLQITADEDFSLEVYDLAGHLILKNNTLNKRITLVSTNYTKGVFIVKITFEKDTKSFKISKN